MRKKVLIFILITLVLLGVFAYVYFFTDILRERSKNAQTNEGANSGEQLPPTDELATKKVETAQTDNLATKPAPVEKSTPRTIGKADLENMAASFAERFGSYSNQSNFSNLTDLEMFMTDQMGKWADSYIRENRGKASGEMYYGITTKAVARETKEYNEESGRVTVLVQTRRREFIGSSNNSSNAFNQDVVINFKKERGAWKVDSATWEGKK